MLLAARGKQPPLPASRCMALRGSAAYLGRQVRRSTAAMGGGL